MAVFVMQTLGCDVAALNTVQFSTDLLWASALPLTQEGDDLIGHL